MLHKKAQNPANSVAILSRDFVDFMAQALGDADNHCERSFINETLKNQWS